ncbi:MAG: transporter [Actinomyces sp.]|nr:MULTISPECIES: TrkA C-terminal domain-containing protein [Actinomycetaceae]MBS6102778.1 transporter [Actinomyces sp.]MDK7144128.1 TrkA C-terminal domain-containing protein [Gleimia europaea]MDU5569081.1 TrkA C-terminal domain-containing protein [Actinomyces sp.]MDU6679832.1 TrkA C-terminal domain-containing protein [Actinomyces sp.]MDU7239625.1 TrkA C-terminal domain-containing protein [Actinomyces sp.]
MVSIFTFFAEQPVLMLFILIGVGMLVGHIKLKGVSLGAAAVLFLAIFVSAWAETLGVEIRIPGVFGVLGLAVFAFAIGVNSGPSFFHNIKTALGPILATVALYIVAAGAAYGLGIYVFDMDIALVAGTFAGALTNTPALAAAGQASGDPGLATVGYSIAYLFGVIGMMIAAMAALRAGKNDTDKPSPLANRTIRVERSDKPLVGDIYEMMGKKVTFSRIRRGETGPIKKPAMSDSLNHDDLVTVVGPRELVARVATELGHGSSHSLMEDRSYLDFRRITVSDPKLAGRTVADLDMGNKFSATISRVRRGDIDMVGEPGLVLQQGDRVRVVAPTSKMREITKFFGDSARGLSDINPVALGLGMALGIVLGELPILTPSGEYFSIGSAAGTLIVGLIFGKIGRIGKVVTAIPYTAAMVLSEFGLLVFLAQAGTVAGGQIGEAFASGSWLNILILGMVVTSIMAVGLYMVMRWIFKMGGTQLAGFLGGSQTQPAVLAFANSRTNADPRVALGYALIYPVAMIGKILVAQVLGGL